MPIVVETMQISRWLESHIGYAFRGRQPERPPTPPARIPKPPKIRRNPIILTREWRRRLTGEGLSRAELARELAISQAG